MAKKSEHHEEDFLSQFLSFGNSREKKKWNLLVKRRRPLFGFGKKLLFPKKEANYDAGRGIYVETETVTEQKYFVLLIGLGRRGKYNLLSGVFT